MKWVDYREKLGMGISDKSKAPMLLNKIATFVENSALNKGYSSEDYYHFCMTTGKMYSFSQFPANRLANEFMNMSLSIPEAISLYIAFVNSKKRSSKDHKGRLISALVSFLDDLNIPCEVIWDDDGAFVFPKGAAELDDALVSQPLEWLSDYPKAHKTFVIALKQYSEGSISGMWLIIFGKRSKNSCKSFSRMTRISKPTRMKSAAILVVKVWIPGFPACSNR